MQKALNELIVRIDKAVLHGKRPRSIGYNARISTHGPLISEQVVRIFSSGGKVGVGWSRVNKEQAQQLLGKRINEVFQLPQGSFKEGLTVDLVLWDLTAKIMDMPLFRLLGARGSREVELYDGSIYIDDLEATDDEAVEIFRKEVKSGQEHGYRNFKIKIGRGARWMPTTEGMLRDVLVINTVRASAGRDAKILIDANMGNTLNSAKEILRACEGVDIYWFEEPFAEDPALNRALKEFIEEKGYNTIIADGEFYPPPYFFDLVKEGWIDIVQHDFRQYGLTWWKATAAQLEQCGARCAPHTWGSYIERYAHAHFAASIPNFDLLEAAPAQIPGIVLNGWEMRDGKLIVPDSVGTGFDVDPDIFAEGIQDKNGFSVHL